MRRNSKGNFAQGSSEMLLRLGAEALNNHSALFSATFCKCAVESFVMADVRLDANLISPKLLTALLKAFAKLKITNFKYPLIYSQVSSFAPKAICKKMVTADVELRIRHGASLTRRKVNWAFSDWDIEHTLIGRPLLETLDIQTKYLILSACDRFNGTVDVSELMPEVSNETKSFVAQLMRDTGIFHSESGPSVTVWKTLTPRLI